jgi:hypothetical protein
MTELERESARSAPASCPRAFISYSWDSKEHKEWTLSLAARLRADGIDAVIDQTHLALGARNPEFMERSVRDSAHVLVVCTEIYKRRFDKREGGAGYEGHIITGEIVSEFGSNKFIPVLRDGDWNSALPTALSGTNGIDLTADSPREYEKLLKHLHGVSAIPPVGQRPRWLDPLLSPSPASASAKPATESDQNSYWLQRKGPDTEIMKKIWSKPRWRIWIRPAEFKKARFQNLDRCRQFMLASYVRVRDWYPYPWFSADAIESGDEWIAAEIEQAVRLERWALFRSGQFVHNRALDMLPQTGDDIHVLEILDTVTGAFELAARMADAGILSPQAVMTFELYGVDGRALTWPEDFFGRVNAVGSGHCADENVSTEQVIPVDELRARRRELALDIALEIYARFGWADPPKARLTEAQAHRFGAVQVTQT